MGSVRLGKKGYVVVVVVVVQVPVISIGGSLLNGSARKYLKVKDDHYPSMQQELHFQGWPHQSSWA